ncbi:MAG: diacylglycerol kinase family protein [Planctomycetota bacterium]
MPTPKPPATTDEPPSPLARLRRKFAHAGRGLAVAVAGRNGFGFHFGAAAAVIVLAWWLDCTRAEWLVLTLAITVVLAAELFNTALEHLARAITRERNPEVRNALDTAAAAVLVTAAGAAIVGAAILTSRLLG